jgi:hypothetical protein
MTPEEMLSIMSGGQKSADAEAGVDAGSEAQSEMETETEAQPDEAVEPDNG